MKRILVLMLINLFYFNVQGATCIFDTLSLKDSFVKFEYRVSGGVALFSPNHLDQIIIYPSGQSFGFVQFNNPKNITKAILSSKETFSFKIPSSIQNDAVANFSKLDFASYAPTFKSLGCLLK